MTLMHWDQAYLPIFSRLFSIVLLFYKRESTQMANLTLFPLSAKLIFSKQTLYCKNSPASSYIELKTS